MQPPCLQYKNFHVFSVKTNEDEGAHQNESNINLNEQRI